MHILTRKRGESLIIGDGIIVYVVEIRDDKVRLGIECPREMPVHKGEAVAAIRQATETQHPA